jgi:methionyl-tRNA synthetase
MVIKYFGGTLCAEQSKELWTMSCSEWRHGLRGVYESQMEKYAFQNALTEIFRVTSRANKYIDETAPWVLAKDDANRRGFASVIYNLLETIRICAVLLIPVMPETSGKILSQIGAADTLRTWDSAAAFGALPKDVTIVKGDVVFPRIDLAKELEILASAL